MLHKICVALICFGANNMAKKKLTEDATVTEQEAVVEETAVEAAPTVAETPAPEPAPVNVPFSVAPQIF